jgi:DNA-binding transcriptional regulator LsrR (DeoR family)
MPTERLSMRRIRDLLRLRYAQGLSSRAIAAGLSISKGAVGAYLSRVRAAGLSGLCRSGVPSTASCAARV